MIKRVPAAGRSLLVIMWARVHGVTPSYLAMVASCWILTALACWIGLPRINPSLVQSSVDLQQFGLVGLAATAGVMSIALSSRYAWLAATTPRSVIVLRLAWFVLVFMTAAGLAVASTLLLPSGLPKVSGYLAVALIWWGVAVMASVIGGRLSSLLAPLALVVVATSKVVPWRFNLIFRPELDAARMIGAGAAFLVAMIAYAVAGTARERRSA